VLYVVQKGLLMNEGIVARNGANFGDDMIISRPELRQRCCVRVLSDTACLLMITRKALYMVADSFPHELKRLRRRATLLAMQRALVSEAKTVREERRRAGKGRSEGTPLIKRTRVIEEAMAQVSELKSKEEQAFRMQEQLSELNHLTLASRVVPEKLFMLEKRLTTLENSVGQHTEMLRDQRQLLEQLVVLNGGTPGAKVASGPVLPEDARPRTVKL